MAGDRGTGQPGPSVASMSSEKGKPFVRSGRHGPHCDCGGQSPRATLQLPLAYHFCPWEARLTQPG